MPHIRSRPVSRVVDLSLMDLSLIRAPKCEPDHSLACFLGDANPRYYPKTNLTGDTRDLRRLRCAAKANTLADVFTLFGSSRNRFNALAGLELPA
jgi:hypothetical protein